jgi:MinD-like ATPase involved in chromosome partitioning or flagellar assembly
MESAAGTPHIDAWVAADGRGGVVVDGTPEPVSGWKPEVTRAVIVARVTDIASGLGRAVELRTDDATTGPVTVLVHPDGAIERMSGAAGGGLPTVGDLLSASPVTPDAPASTGWRGAVARLSGGRVALPPAPAEARHRDAVRRVQRPFDGPRTVVVINPKGGAQKTTATLLLAATFGLHRGGSVLAWDNNETRGTLGWRAAPGPHTKTAVDLLGTLDRFGDDALNRIGDLDRYVRPQIATQFDVLASDEDAAASSTIDVTAFRRLHATLARFYRVIVVDTGNNMRASNWIAAIESADQLVIVSTEREDTAASAAWLVDGLREKGQHDKVRDAVTVLAAPAKNRDDALTGRLHSHFRQLNRSVLDVPYDPSLVGGGRLSFDALAPATREAWLRVAAEVADGL